MGCDRQPAVLTLLPVPLQEAQRAQQAQIQARFPIPCPQRTQYEDTLRQQLQSHLNGLKQRHAQMKAMEASSMASGRMQQQSGFNSYNQVRLPALPDPPCLAPQALCCSPLKTPRRLGSELPTESNSHLLQIARCDSAGAEW